MDCDRDHRCNECQGWSRSTFKTYLSSRRVKERQERYRVRRRAARSLVAPPSSSIIQNKCITANNVIADCDSAVIGPDDSISQTPSVR